MTVAAIIAIINDAWGEVFQHVQGSNSSTQTWAAASTSTATTSGATPRACPPTPATGAGAGHQAAGPAVVPSNGPAAGPSPVASAAPQGLSTYSGRAASQATQREQEATLVKAQADIERLTALSGALERFFQPVVERPTEPVRCGG